MLIEVIVFAGAVAGGFALGRVKNKAKLAAAQIEADKLKASAQAALKKR